jgi:hypothetical protein
MEGWGMIPVTLIYELIEGENAVAVFDTSSRIVTILDESDLITLLAAIQGDSAYVPDATGGL